MVWKEYAAAYATLMEHNSLYTHMRSRILSFVSGQDSVLDAGCGPGFTTKANGHGVGLYAVASHVQDNCGFIHCRNLADNAGVEFTTYLPTQELFDYVMSLLISKE